MRARTPLLVITLLVTVLSGCVSSDSKGLEDEAGVAQGAPPLVRVGPPAGLSEIIYTSLVREPVFVPATMDGITLRVDVYRPDEPGPFPTILVQSPYWSFGSDAKENEKPTWYIDYFVPRGYAVALGEMRGTRDSGGCWDFGGPRDQQDGHDIVEALAAQPWSNGKVGMLGQSHVGMSQIAAAITAPPHLTTIVPIAAVSDWYRYLHKDGAPYTLNRATPPAYFAVHASPSTESVDPQWVLTQAQTACVDNMIHLSQSAELDGNKDAYWQERDLIAGAGNIQASVFLVHGFLDENVKTDHFLDLWQALPDDLPKKAWYGQWFHQHPQYYEWREDLHQWFDYWLMGIENGIMDAPVVTVQDNLRFNRTEADWPPRATTIQNWTLGPSSLVHDEEAEAGLATYMSVPGDDRAGPPDIPEDSVEFSSQPLAADYRVLGRPTMTLEGTLDKDRGRWIAILWDEAADGSRDEVTRAYRDAQHREDLTSQTPVAPGQALEYTLNFYPRDHVVQAGHRLVLELRGGDLGCYTGGECEGTGILPVELPVSHTVATGSDAATRLHLPVQAHGDLGRERVLTPLESWLNDLPP